MKNRIRISIVFFIFLLIVFSSRSEAWIKILQGDKIDVGMNHTVAIACTTNEAYGISWIFDWSEAWGYGDWLMGAVGNYDVFLFDPNATATPPEPFDSGTLTV